MMKKVRFADQEIPNLDFTHNQEPTKKMYGSILINIM
jgi:hypothetical protein